MLTSAKFFHSFLLGGCLLAMLTAVAASAEEYPQPLCISGVYPHLAMSNRGGECGVGAVVPWADRLWVITYPPHKPGGSDDGLYEVTRDLRMTRRPESVGGTCANRLIHRESNQLFIGPYAIDAQRNVRAIPFKKMPGRHTATARHLTDPTNKVYTFTMEEGLFEVDVNDLSVKTIHRDRNARGVPDLLPGYHGKGAYSAGGVLVVSNNGEKLGRRDWLKPGPAGCLAEWDGKQWQVIERTQFCEVTGPGGISGNAPDEDRIFATGFDHRSAILMLREDGKWHRYRLPKASYTYDARHGWYTEWPRIREIDNGRMLMNMHGLLWEFPRTFSATNTAGIKPLSSHLRIFGDFCYWNDYIVFGCDDAARIDSKLYGGSQSNLWFVKRDELDDLGPVMGFGGVWVDDDVKAGEASDPFLTRGFSMLRRFTVHDQKEPVTFRIECDVEGNGKWEKVHEYTVEPGGHMNQDCGAWFEGTHWIRVVAESDCKATVCFQMGISELPVYDADAMWQALPNTSAKGGYCFGTLTTRNDEAATLQFAASTVDGEGKVSEAGLYHVTPEMKLQHVADARAHAEVTKRSALGKVKYEVDAMSVLVKDGQGRRWRLPKGNVPTEELFPFAGTEEWRKLDLRGEPFAWGRPRDIRPVMTERFLFNAGGTFYELPDESAGGFAKIKPICTHNRIISDFCAWRGMLVVAGCELGAEEDGHYFASGDGEVGLWFGAVDDLWKLGAPRGAGAVWLESEVKADEPSDPFLLLGFEDGRLDITHHDDRPATFTIEVDPTGGGDWQVVKRLKAQGQGTSSIEFRYALAGHWIRIRADRDCTATAIFVYSETP